MQQTDYSSMSDWTSPQARPTVPSWMQLKPVAQAGMDIPTSGQSYTWFDQPNATITDLGVNKSIVPYGANPVPVGGLNNNMQLSNDGVGGWLREKGIIGTRDQQGWGGLALGAATGIGSLYLGMQQYNLAKDALANNKAQYAQNYAAQRSEMNTNLEDRQRARVASNSGAYQSVGDYMAANGIK